MKRNRLIRISATFGALALGLILTFQNCAPNVLEDPEAANSPSNKVDHAELEAVYEEAETLLARDLSCVSDSDCASLAFGHRPCGGPSTHLVSSLRNRDFAHVESLADQHRSLSKRWLQENHPDMMGTCDMRMPPEVSCQAGRCAAASNP